MSSDEYDRNRSSGSPKLLLKIETADARQTHIEYETTGTISCFFSPELFRRFKSNRLETDRLKKSLYRCTYASIVVNYVHCWDSRRCHLRPLGNLSTTLPEGAANLPRYDPRTVSTAGFPIRFAPSSAAMGRPWTRTPSSACKLASYPSGPNDAPFPRPSREQQK